MNKMSKKELLKQKSRGKLSTGKKADTVGAVIVQGNELDRLTLEIRSDLEEMKDIFDWWKDKKEKVNELKQSILEKLIFVRDKKKKLLGKRNFEDYLTSDIGISKGYFYEQLQAYNICKEYKKPGLFREVDHKVLVNIAREKDKEKQKYLINEAPSLTRDDFKKVSPTDFSEEPDITIDKAGLSLTVSDKKILKAIEQFLKNSGFNVSYLK